MSTNIGERGKHVKMVIALVKWRKRRFPVIPVDDAGIERASRFVHYYRTLPEESEQCVHVCPQGFVYQEVAHASVVPADCGHCGIQTFHAPGFVLEAVITDTSDIEYDLRQSFRGHC